MVEQVPIGSLVGLGLIILVIGIILGRSQRFMSKMGSLHASAHGGSAAAKAAAQGGNADQRVQTIVVVDRDGVPKKDGRYDLDAVVAVADDRSDRHVGAGHEAFQLEQGADDGWPAEGLPVVRNAGRVAK